MEGYQWDILVSFLICYRYHDKGEEYEIWSQRIQIRELINSCFNAFSRVDIRVDVKIPGGVEAYVVDLRGERYVPFRLGSSFWD